MAERTSTTTKPIARFKVRKPDPAASPGTRIRYLALIVISRVELRYWAVLAAQSGDRVIEVAHQRGGVAAEPAQLQAFSCPVL